MRIIVFGATGRVGASVVEQALESGHEVTAFVRDRRRLNPALSRTTIAEGDIRNQPSVRAALQPGFDAIVNAIGESGLKPSTVVTDSVSSITSAMKATGNSRFLGVSGTAEMDRMTPLGKLTIAVLRATPVGHPIRDHDGALRVLRQSGLSWMLAGCGYIKSGPRVGRYRTSLVLNGGFKVVHPPDVADLIVRELIEGEYTGHVVGIWY